MTTARGLALVFALLAPLYVGCAENAVFELKLELPNKGAVTTPLFAVVQARSGEPDFADMWAGSDPLDGFELSAEPQTVPISVVADEDTVITSPMRMRIRFCGSSDCSEIGSDNAFEYQLHFDRVFYVGQSTSYTVTIPATPAMDVLLPAVRKCDIQGCRNGVASDYCRLDGTHFCE